MHKLIVLYSTINLVESATSFPDPGTQVPQRISEHPPYPVSASQCPSDIFSFDSPCKFGSSLFHPRDSSTDCPISNTRRGLPKRYPPRSPVPKIPDHLRWSLVSCRCHSSARTAPKVAVACRKCPRRISQGIRSGFGCPNHCCCCSS